MHRSPGVFLNKKLNEYLRDVHKHARTTNTGHVQNKCMEKSSSPAWQKKSDVANVRFSQLNSAPVIVIYDQPPDTGFNQHHSAALGAVCWTLFSTRSRLASAELGAVCWTLFSTRSGWRAQRWHLSACEWVRRHAATPNPLDKVDHTMTLAQYIRACGYPSGATLLKLSCAWRNVSVLPPKRLQC